MLAAWGFTASGAKVLLHLMVGSKEDAETVSAFFQDMRQRGLGDPLLVVSDGAAGIIKFVEERRRLKIVPNAFGEKPVLKLMFGAMIRAAERWRAIRISDLERRQMRAVREELDQEYQAPDGLNPTASANASPSKFSSSSRT